MRGRRGVAGSQPMKHGTQEAGSSMVLYYRILYYCCYIREYSCCFMKHGWSCRVVLYRPRHLGVSFLWQGACRRGELVNINAWICRILCLLTPSEGHSGQLAHTYLKCTLSTVLSWISTFSAYWLSSFCSRGHNHRVHIGVEIKYRECTYPLMWIVHCNFVRDGNIVKGCGRAPPHLHQTGMSFPSW